MKRRKQYISLGILLLMWMSALLTPHLMRGGVDGHFTQLQENDTLIQNNRAVVSLKAMNLPADRKGHLSV